MNINQTKNSQKAAIDLSQLPSQKHLPENRTTAPQEAGKIPSDLPLDASVVSLSEEGRATASRVDFNATADTLSKLNALGKSDSFARAHTAIAYETVKNLLD